MKIKKYLSLKLTGSCLLALTLIAPGLSLSAAPGDSFVAGDWYFDLNVGQGEPEGRLFSIFEPSLLYQGEVLLNLASTNAERQALGFFQLSTLEDPEPLTRSAFLGAEYALADWFGLGFGISNLRTRVEKVNIRGTFEYIFLYSILLDGLNACVSPILCSSTAPNRHEYLTLWKSRVEFEDINTLDFNPAFHFFTGANVDPFLKLTVGIGQVKDVNVLKAGASLGLRYFVSESFFVSGAVYGYNYNLSASGEDSGDSDASENFTDKGLKFGIGFRI